MKLEYDYELYRKNAFIIAGNKLIEGDLHYECMIKALSNNESEYYELYEKDDWELENMTLEKFNQYTIGEVAEINNNKYIIAYDTKDIDIINKYYNHKILILENNEFITIEE